MYGYEFINYINAFIILVLVLCLYKWYYWKKKYKNARYIIRIYEIKLYDLQKGRFKNGK